MFFGKNVQAVLVNELIGILGMEKVEDPGLYLGVPAIWGRSKKCGLAYVKGRLLGKFKGINCRERGVDQGCGISYSSISDELFKFPITFWNKLDAMIVDF